MPCSMICNTLLLAAAVLRIDTSVVAFAPMQMRATATIAAPSRTTTLAFATKDDDDDEEEQPDPGMAAAFRQLDNLKSLDDGGDKNKPKQTPRPKKPIDASNVNVQGTEAVSPEKEVQLYKEMVQELEETDEDDLYSNVLKDMGGSPAMTTPTPSIQTDQAEGTLPKTTEDFMNQALDEALKEVKIKNSSSVDSILDDKEIMQEIEAIFERGNEQLMESLEEMRREQQELAKASADKSNKNRVEATEETAERLAQAEASMEVMLKRVNQETAEVEKAVTDLKAAQEDMDSGFVSKLRSGGLPKQAALVGFLLFSVRSIIDSISSFNDESLLAGALIQGAVAIVCAIVFFFL